MKSATTADAFNEPLIDQFPANPKQDEAENDCVTDGQCYIGIPAQNPHLSTQAALAQAGTAIEMLYASGLNLSSMTSLSVKVNDTTVAIDAPRTSVDFNKAGITNIADKAKHHTLTTRDITDNAQIRRCGQQDSAATAGQIC